MSYDASSLRGYLQRIDGSAPAIQGAAGAMMKHYDKSPGVAVVEWRNALMQAQGHQFLPLLYVANEILQNSKRNRGNKFLEAFSPVLGQSLIFVCAKSPPELVESIRRTVKIWAERRVFSVRYVNELIKGLEPYRNGNGNRGGGGGRKRQDGNSSPREGRFSPVTELTSAVQQPQELNPSTTSTSKSKSTMESKDDFDSEMGMGNDDDDDYDGDDTFGNNNDDDDDVDSDDNSDDDLFGNASKSLLNIDVDFDRASSTAKKRRRSSIESTASDNNNDAYKKNGKSAKSKSKHKRRHSTQYLSTNSLMELMNQVSALQASYDRVTGKLQEIHKLNGNGDDNNNHAIETLVGDELLAEYKKVLLHQQQIDRHRRELHSIAQKRRGLELEALRYLPWLEQSLNQDQEDIDFSDRFRKQLDLFRGVYQPTKQARDYRLKEEERRLDEEEELRKKRHDEEERKKFLKSAMSKQTEAQPGMVWNRATGEYQHLNQEESWRDWVLATS